MANFTKTSAYKGLQKNKEFLKDMRLSQLFADNPRRAAEFGASACGILFDFSKNLLDARTLDGLVRMADQLELRSRIRDLFDGVKLNRTEGRAALHTALRAAGAGSIILDGRDIVREISATRSRMFGFAESVHSGSYLGATGARILDVVNIGIGGSHLGPKMAVRALSAFASPLIKTHFVSNVDAASLKETLSKLSPETTLFIVSSKTFATDETMTNAASAREWLATRLGTAAVRRHFCAVSANARAAADFGVERELVFPFGDYVGGRYSVWGPVGLALAVAIGSGNFERFLAGARDADSHFRTAPLRSNLPVLMALVGVWNNNFLGITDEVVLPYSEHLEYLPSYLQQLVMESNGKSVDSAGRPVAYATAPSLWGEPGTNGQHSFYQLLHQGARKILCDFILVARPPAELGHHSLKLLANAIAQSEALMLGADNPDPARKLEGNRPSNAFLLDRLDPYSLGALLALFEHRTFVEASLWDINPFDQMGVELGKKLAEKVLDDLEGTASHPHDSSTSSLISEVKRLRG